MMNTYQLVAKPQLTGWDAPAWLWAIHDIDGEAEMAQMDDDADGNVVYEIYTSHDLSDIAKVKGVVSLERM